MRLEARVQAALSKIPSKDDVGAILGRVRERLPCNVAEATAMVAIGTPIGAYIETHVAGMHDYVSLKSRALGALLVYGLMPAAMLFREYTQQYAGVAPESSERERIIHDAKLGAVSGLLSKPPLYLISGETDPVKIVVGTLAVTAMSTVMLPLTLYAADVFKELVGIEESTRTPRWIKRYSSRAKRLMAAGAIGFSVATTGVCYVMSQGNTNTQQVQHIEMGQNSVYAP